MEEKLVTLAHGAGGKQTSELIESIDILGKMLNKYIKSIGKTND